MNFLRSRRGVVLLGVAALLALFLFRPGGGRLKNRIAGSLGSALQRPVEIGYVHVRLLPQPGFDLEEFVVHDDPAFSAEPVLRAQEVTAYLRVLSLLRGRLEVSRLNLTEPSLNLVRNAEGHWNLESMLEHARQTPIAPTGARSSAGHPAFPYIEASDGRINFKLGSEKKPFALTNADYSLWQDSGSSWGMRLKAQPLRTDLNLSDTGTLRVNGTWQRADSLRNTPIQFTAQWERAQLGQVTKMFSDRDRGWRATVRWNANLSGTPGDLVIDSQAELEDFRRSDILAPSALNLRVRCAAHYSSVDRGFHEIDCESPVGEGSIAVTGNIARVLDPPEYGLAMRAERVPMSAVLELARRMKRELPADLQADGVMTADMRAAANGTGRMRSVTLTGSGSTKGLRLASESNKTDLLLDEVPFEMRNGTRLQKRGSHDAAAPMEPQTEHVFIGPFHPDHAAGLSAQGWAGAQGYSLWVAGDSTVQHLLQAARSFGLAAPQPTADGAAKVDLLIAGDWAGFAPAKITGNAQMKNTRLEIRGLAGPIEVASASLALKADRVEVQNVSATAAGSHWTGSLTLPRPCATLPACAISFNLSADMLSTERLSKFVNPSGNAPWYRFLTPEASSGLPFLSRLNASGKLSATQFVIRSFTAKNVTTGLSLQNGLLKLRDLRGDTLGGKHRGQWEVDFSARPPKYAGEGSFEHVTLTELAAEMRNDWIAGVGNGQYEVKASGGKVADILREASGSLRFDVSDATLKHVLVDGAPLRAQRFAGELALRSGEFGMEVARLESPGATYTVSGTATWARSLDFKLVRDKNSSLAVTGTLDAPRVLAIHTPATEAALKR